MKTIKQFLILGFVSLHLVPSANVFAHCEIPCGIYDDQLRIDLIKEHITTIEKSMNQINELSASGDKNYNQLVRWINNKEKHATELQEIVSQYFLHQRIKITDPEDKEAYAKYQKELELLHHLQVYAMKAKQTTDLQYIQKLSETVAAFEDIYFHKHE